MRKHTSWSVHVKSNCPDLGDYYGINETHACSDPVLFTYMIFCVAREVAGTPHTNDALNVYILKIINTTKVAGLGFLKIFI